MNSCHKIQHVGLRLIDPIDGGGNGIINGVQHFQAPPGHGLYVPITDIIQKVNASELMMKMQEVVSLCRTRLDQYVNALSERDAYIEKLKKDLLRFRKMDGMSLTHSLHTLIAICVRVSYIFSY